MSVTEARDYPDPGASDEYEKPRDKPVDREFNLALWQDFLSKNGTFSSHSGKPGFRMLYLQRLANPMIAWNADTNPYRTVDQMQVDLTTFNGATKDSPSQTSGEGKEGEIGGGGTQFATRERGFSPPAVDRNSSNTCLLWRVDDPTTDPPVEGYPKGAAATDHCFNDAFTHSLGKLSRCYGVNTSTIRGGQIWTSTTITGAYSGDPKSVANGQQPFPWLKWNNRPFANPMELLEVPILRSSLWLRCYGAQDMWNNNPYGATSLVSATTGGPPFPHLANYFQGQANGTKLGRVLDYVGVPSPFMGTDVQLNPALAATSTGHLFHPPFNRVSTYREPGRVNLNTIFSYDVFRGLLNHDSNTTSSNETAIKLWEAFVRSRRGYAVSTSASSPNERRVLDGMIDINSTLPTRFARPFRSYAGASLVPKVPSSGTYPSLWTTNEADFSLLRMFPNDASALAPPVATDQYRPLFGSYFTNPYRDTQRNPFFRYRGLERLGNLVTTRSNVYAVWITVGYFEARKIANVNSQILAVCPDGYDLGLEVGIDTGEVKRHRAFYILDRSIPVGFVRGQNVNWEKALLVKRIIE